MTVKKNMGRVVDNFTAAIEEMPDQIFKGLCSSTFTYEEIKETYNELVEQVMEDCGGSIYDFMYMCMEAAQKVACVTYLETPEPFNGLPLRELLKRYERWDLVDCMWYPEEHWS